MGEESGPPAQATVSSVQGDIGVPQPPYSAASESGDNRFLGAMTSQSTQGIWANIKVANPSVHRGTSDFFVASVMVHQYDPNLWIQVGWAEAGWRDDKQYVFVYDTEWDQWIFYDQFSISPDDWITVAINTQGGTKWAAWLWNASIGIWILLQKANLGFSSAQYSSQFAEACANEGSEFYVPETSFFLTRILVAENWDIWDTKYPTFEYNTDPPYDTHWQNKYWNWYMHGGIKISVLWFEGNLRSEGRWIAAYIQLPEEYSAADIDATTILVNGTIAPVLDPWYGFVVNSSEYLIDHNYDGALERMVKFDRASVASWIYQSVEMQDKVTLSITGQLTDGTPFEGTDTIFAFWQHHKSPSKQ